jgi:tryptophanyl-tRNA synthetase
MLNSEFDPEYVFTHHSATPEKLRQYAIVHDAAKQFARVLLESVPASEDRDSALRLLREAAMMACAAISLDGRMR